MHKFSYSSEVHASLETVWKLLVRKVEQPQRYVPGVVESRILQHYNDGVLREVKTEGMLIKEKVVLDQRHGEIHFFMIDHPLFSGRVINRVVPTSIQNPAAPQLLTIEVHWSGKHSNGEQLEAELRGQVEREVLGLKQEAEALDRDFRGKKTGYAFGRTLSAPFSQAVRKVRDELQKEGFGIITEIDMRQKFRVKLQKEFRNYVILGACNPALAYQAMGLELDIGTLLPCNVVVYEVEEGTCVVMAMDPVAALSVVGSPRLTDLAATVKERLGRALSSL